MDLLSQFPLPGSEGIKNFFSPWVTQLVTVHKTSEPIGFHKGDVIYQNKLMFSKLP